MKPKISTLDDNLEVDLKRKRETDPLTSINTVMKEYEKTKKKSKEKDYKKEKKSLSLPPVKKSKTIEELRAERYYINLINDYYYDCFKNNELLFNQRIKREADERLKAERLLYGSKEPVKVAEFDDRKRKYNNQFNPDISKY